MRFPWMVVSVTSSFSAMPVPEFPEIRLPEPAVVPPMTVVAASWRPTPVPFPIALEPAELVPM